MEYGYHIEGLSSHRVRHFLNHLCSDPGNTYLEIGSYTGSTYFAAIMNNNIYSYAVDNFEHEIAPARDDIIWKGVKDPKQSFMKNNMMFGSLKSTLLDKDANDINEDDINRKPNIIFYDGDHDENQVSCLNNLLPLLADTFVLVLDDANFDGVIRTGQNFVEINNLELLFERQILTPELEDSTSWWNGLYILILKKR